MLVCVAHRGLAAVSTRGSTFLLLRVLQEALSFINEVIELSERSKAVELEPDNKEFQYSRGLARGLTGDLAGAKADFQALLNSGYNVYSTRVENRYI
jgi:hypothetical protein